MGWEAVMAQGTARLRTPSLGPGGGGGVGSASLWAERSWGQGPASVSDPQSWPSPYVPFLPPDFLLIDVKFT